MSGFWDLSDGGDAAKTGDNYEQPGGGNFAPIPDGSDVLAEVVEAKWANTSKDDDGANFVSLQWSVLQPKEYANRRVFQKLFVTDFDPSVKDADKATKKRDKARRMLAAIDANAGGKLTARDEKPTNDSMTLCLCNKPMIIKTMIWEMPDRERHGEVIQGNWISAVKPKAAGVNITAEAPAKPKAQSRQQSGGGGTYGGGSGYDDEIPF